MFLVVGQIRLNHHPLHFIKTHLVELGSYSCVVRVEAWFAIVATFSSVPPFLR